MPDADDHDHGAVEYSLVMPFVVCASKGGPYDDDAYVAGWEMGQLDAGLKAGWDGLGGLPRQLTIRTQNVPQADLIALKNGFVMESRPAEMFGEEWSYVRFTKPALTDGGESHV